MKRTLTFFAATVAAAIAVSSACLASARPDHDFRADDIDFALTQSKEAGRVQLSLRRGSNHHMSNSFLASDLAGLDLSRLNAGVASPVSFALVREAGRIDCAGEAKAKRADGKCRFTVDPAFSALLASRGIGTPDAEESYQLAMAGVTRDLVEAIHAARYPTPTVDDLTALAALGVDRKFIQELSSRGYRPAQLDDLVKFAALNVTPDYIDGMARAGFRDMDADAIVQFKALGISPGYVAELARIGYSDLDTDEVAQLKALDVTPAYVEDLSRLGYVKLPVDTLVQLKALGVTPAYVRSLRASGLASLSPEQLVALKAVGHRRVRK